MKLYQICLDGGPLRATLIYTHGDDVALAEEFGKLYLTNDGFLYFYDYSFFEIAKIESDDIKIGQIIYYDDGEY